MGATKPQADKTHTEDDSLYELLSILDAEASKKWNLNLKTLK